MPKMAQQMDKIAVIRSMHTSEVDHPGGIYLMHTGYRPVGQRALPRGRRDRRQVPGRRRRRPAELRQGVVARRRRGRLPRAEVSAVRHRLAKAACRRSRFRRWKPTRESSAMTCVRSSRTASPRTRRRRRPGCTARPTRRARRLQKGRDASTSTPSGPSTATSTATASFGKRCLLARRLVESGVAFIEVGQSSYDSHADNFTTASRPAPADGTCLGRPARPT